MNSDQPEHISSVVERVLAEIRARQERIRRAAQQGTGPAATAYETEDR